MIWRLRNKTKNPVAIDETRFLRILYKENRKKKEPQRHQGPIMQTSGCIFLPTAPEIPIIAINKDVNGVEMECLRD